MKEHGIDKPEVVSTENNSEEKVLYGKDFRDIVTGINKWIVKAQFFLKISVIIFLSFFLARDLSNFHNYCMEIFSKAFSQGTINHDNSSLLKIIFFSSFLGIVGLTAAIVTLTLKQSLLPLENKEEKKRKINN
jgi:predicted PurR-regulated permease PerM